MTVLNSSSQDTIWTLDTLFSPSLCYHSWQGLYKVNHLLWKVLESDMCASVWSGLFWHMMKGFKTERKIESRDNGAQKCGQHRSTASITLQYRFNNRQILKCFPLPSDQHCPTSILILLILAALWGLKSFENLLCVSGVCFQPNREVVGNPSSQVQQLTFSLAISLRQLLSSAGLATLGWSAVRQRITYQVVLGSKR